MNRNHQHVTKKLPTDGIVFYTDGACKGNPGPGGWGVSMQKLGVEFKALHGGDPSTTNNRMELHAVIEALLEARYAKYGISKFVIVTDSQYVLQGATDWINGWKHRNWIKADKKPVVNKELWMKLDELCSVFEKITWCWQRGHVGNPGNERADQLANMGCATLMEERDAA